MSISQEEQEDAHFILVLSKPSQMHVAFAKRHCRVLHVKQLLYPSKCAVGQNFLEVGCTGTTNFSSSFTITVRKPTS